MKLIKMQCPNCGAALSVAANAEKAVCEYCGTVIPVQKSEAKVTVRRKTLSRKPFVIFGIVAAVIIIAAVAIVLSVGKGGKADSRVYKTEGVYLVGEDIPAGEYILYPHIEKGEKDVDPVYEVRLTRDRVENASDLLYRKKFYMRQYVNLNDGEYIAFEYAYLYLPENAKLKKLDENGYSQAQLKVGKDIEAGEYVIAGELNKRPYYFITANPYTQDFDGANLNAPDMIDFDGMENRVYVRVKDGEYLSFTGGRLYRIDNAPAPHKTQDGAFAPGQYKVGTDIKSGKYTVIATDGKASSAYVCINKNCTDTSSQIRQSHIAEGGENILRLHLENSDGVAVVDIPKPSDGEDIYITLYYCTASAE